MSRVRADSDPLSTPLKEEDEGRDLDALYRRNAAWLRAALLHRFGPRLAPSVDDLVQETYIRAARLQAAGLIRSPRALLGEIARRLAVDEVRRQSVRAAALPTLASQSGGRSEAEQHERLLLKQVILSMPERDRTVFLLARFEGLTHAQIAGRLGISQKAVEWRMIQALLHCQTHLGR